MAGAVIGAAIWVYFFGAMYWKTRWPSVANWFLMMLLGPLMIGGMALGFTVCALIALKFGH